MAQSDSETPRPAKGPLVTPSQPPQQRKISSNEGLLLCSAPALQLALARFGGRSVAEGLAVNERHRAAPAREDTCAPIVVSLDSPLEVVGLTDIEDAIGATQDVDGVHVE